MLYPLARKTLIHALNVGTVPFLKGPPGIGKTDMVTSAADELGREVVTETLATMEPIDLRGLPNTEHATKSVWWSKPEFLIRLEEAAARSGKPPILFIDEANAAGQELQVPLMQLTLRGVVGPHKLPDATSIVLAGNRRQDRAAAQASPTALNNRVMHVPVELCVKSWLKWAAQNQIHPAIVALIQLRGEGQKGTKGQPDKPGLLHIFDPTKPDQEAFCSPRTWAMSNPWIEADDDIREGGIRGLVGEFGSTELEGFLKIYRDLPPLPQIFANPDKAALPTNSSTRYAVTLALSRHSTSSNFGNAIKYVGRIGPEYEAMLVNDAINRHTHLANTQAYIHWSALNAAKLI